MLSKFYSCFPIIIILFLSTHIVGQDKYVNSNGDTILIQAIKPTQVFQNIENINQQIESSRTKLAPGSRILEIDSIAKEALVFLSSEEKRINQTKFYSNPREVSDQQMIWSRYYTKLKNWQEPVTTRSQLLLAEIESTDIAIKTWELTRKNAKEQNVSTEMLNSIDLAIKDYRKFYSELKKQQDYTFSLQNQITEMIIRVDAVISQLEKAKQDVRKQYFVPEAPPIWGRADSTFKEIKLKEAFSQSIKKNYALVINYVPGNLNSLYLHLFIFLMILIFLLFLKKKLNTITLQEEYKQSPKVNFVSRQYVLSAFLLSFISIIWLYPGSPLVIREILQFLALIPTFVLLQYLSNNRIRPYLYSLLFVFLIDEFYFLFESSIHLARIILILISAYTIWLIIKFRNPKGKVRPYLQGKGWKLVLQISFLAALILITAFLAAILGYLNISSLLVRAVIDAFFMGILIYLLVYIITSIFQIVFTIGLLNELNIVKKYHEKILAWLISIINLLGIFVWIRSIFISLGVLNSFVQWANTFLDSKWEIGSINISLGAFLGFFTAIIFTFVIFRLIRVILNDEVFTRLKLPRGVPGAISMIVGYFIVAVGIYIAISAAGVDLGQFGLIAGALGVGIGFGLQNIVFNFISGLILAFERPVQVGDTVEVGTLLGSIKSIGVRSSTVKTFDGSEVIVPNGNLISNEVVNWTLSDRKRRRMIPVSVAYGSDPREVLALINKAAEDHPEVLENPAPWALFDGFGESSLNFRIYFWVSYDRGMTIQSEIAMAIYDALAIAKINIPFPQQDLHIKTITSEFDERKLTKAIVKNKKPKPKKEDPGS